MPSIVTIETQIQCPHQAPALLTTTNASLTVDGVPALLETDMPTIVGCPFVIGVVSSPCVSILWMSASELFSVDGTAVILEDSVGLCVNPAGAPQGPAIINGASEEVDSL